MNPAFDSRAIDILIRLDYFREFGTPGKLLNVYKQFQEGDSRFSKIHVKPTQERRLAILRQLEQNSPEEVIKAKLFRRKDILAVKLFFC